MRSRYEAWLNGVALSSVNPDILILDIEYAPIDINNETFSVAKRQGARLHRRYIEKTSVNVSFAIRKYSIQERQSVCGDVVRWAKNGGVLTVNDRLGQRLRCICETFPVIESAMKWTEALRITFTAYALPFWEEEAPVTLHLTGTDEEGELYVPGNIDGAMIEVAVTANSALTTLALGANGKLINLNGLSVPSGGVIELKYNDEMIQSIKADGVSILNKRSGADDLLAICGGENSLAFASDADADVVFSVRGLWL